MTLSRRARGWWCLALGVEAAIACRVAAAEYVLRDLGTLGGSVSLAFGLNDAGQVVGSSYLAGGTTSHACLWEPGQGIIDLGTLGGTQSEARRINNSGWIVGWAELPGGNDHAFRY